MKLKKSLLLAVVAIFAFLSFAETKTYVGVAGQNAGCGDFNDPANWSPEGVPGENDDVIINRTSGNYGCIVSITSNVKIASLTINGSKPCVLALFARNDAATQASASLDTQELPDLDDESEAVFEVTGDVKLKSAKILLGKNNWKRVPKITVGGNLELEASSVFICAGDTNEVNSVESGTGFLTVKGDTTLKSSSKIQPVSNDIHGGGVVFAFKDLEVASGSSFDASGVGGFATAYAPGYSANNASYGGRATTESGKTYGEAATPYLPGSSSSKGIGGGAIRIVATNIVLNGSIAANGQDGVVNYGPSGGSVWIKSKTLKGSGVISANAGYQRAGRLFGALLPGGGGRIALNIEEEVGEDFALSVSAAPSVCTYPSSFMAGRIDYGGGEPGTIWANRISTIHSILPRCKGGVFHSPDFPSVFTNAVAEIPSKAYWYFPLADDIVFTNDVKFSAGSILGVGAYGSPYQAEANDQPYTRYIGRNQRVFFYGDVTSESNSCIIVNSSRSSVRAGLSGTSTCEFFGDFEQGGSLLAYGQGDEINEIKVHGDWTLDSTANVYPISDVYSGIGVCFDVGCAFTALEGSTVYATGRGYGTTNSSLNVATIAPGRPGAPETYSNGGGSYGGSNCTSTAGYVGFGPVYGNRFLPLYPGSCGKYGDYARNPGGGSVQIRADTVSIAGSIHADGLEGYHKGYASSSGGGILITSRKKEFSVAPTAVITANGGSSLTTSTINYNGGGGRIALGIGVKDETLAKWKESLAELDDVYEEVFWSPGKKVSPFSSEMIAQMFGGAMITANGGSNDSYTAEDGTVCIYNGPIIGGLKIIVK